VGRLRAAVPDASIAAIGIVGQGPTCVATDAEARPTHRIVTWLDTRSGREAADLTSATGRSGWSLGIMPIALRIERTEPSVAARTRWYLTSWEWVAMRLSGVAASTAPLGHEPVDPHGIASTGLPIDKLAPKVPTGQVVGSVTEHRGRWDFVRHIRDVVEQFPQAKRFHWVMDNLNTHYTFELCQYLGRLSGVWEARPRLRTGAQRRSFLTDPGHKHVVHYTPKHGSWLNQVEIWFGVLSRRLLRRGEFRSVGELAQRILEFIDYYDRHDAHPYEWTYTGKPLVSGDAPGKKKRTRHRRKLLVNMRSR